MSDFKMSEHFGSKVALVIDGAGEYINQIHYYNPKRKCSATDELHCSGETAEYIHHSICTHDRLVQEIAQLKADKAELVESLNAMADFA